MLISVDLPAPFSPMIPVIEARRTARLTSRLAWTAPKRLSIWQSSIAGGGSAGASFGDAVIGRPIPLPHRGRGCRAERGGGGSKPQRPRRLSPLRGARGKKEAGSAWVFFARCPASCLHRPASYFPLPLDGGGLGWGWGSKHGSCLWHPPP